VQLGVNPDTHTMDLNQDNQDPLEHHTLTIIPFGASYVNVMAMFFVHIFAFTHMISLVALLRN